MLMRKRAQSSTEPEPRDAAPQRATNLCDCRPGTTVRVRLIPRSLACAQRLRELGIVEGEVVMLLRQSDPILLLAKQSRIALDRATARQIEVSHESL